VLELMDIFPDVSRCRGVHIRNRLPTREFKLGMNEYPIQGWKDLIKYRKVAKVSLFSRVIKDILKKEPRMCFFVAADNQEAKDELTTEFGPGTIYTLNGVCADRSTKCMQSALAELYILGNTTGRIIGSYWSSFSEMAGILNGYKPLYAGKDFF
jgi:hypothetical protein